MKTHNYGALANHLETAVLVFDESKRLQWLNYAAQSLFKFGRTSRGRPWHELFGSNLALTELCEKSLSSEQSYTKLDVNYYLFESEQPTVLHANAHYLDECSLPTGVVLELQDVTHKAKADDVSFKASLEQAHANTIKHLAHEVKNPLGGILGSAQLLEMLNLDEKSQQCTQLIINEVNRLRDTVDKLLGPNTLNLNPHANIHLVLEQAKSLMEMQFGVEIEADYDPSIPEIEIDETYISQVITNLLKNSLEEISVQNVTLRTRIVNHALFDDFKRQAAVKIEVIDDGNGIQEKDLKRIFKPLFTNKKEGSGVGLSLSMMLVRRHHGVIDCVSEPGRTVFSVVLPLKQERIK